MLFSGANGEAQRRSSSGRTKLVFSGTGVASEHSPRTFSPIEPSSLYVKPKFYGSTMHFALPLLHCNNVMRLKYFSSA